MHLHMHMHMHNKCKNEIYDIQQMWLSEIYLCTNAIATEKRFNWQQSQSRYENNIAWFL